MEGNFRCDKVTKKCKINHLLPDEIFFSPLNVSLFSYLLVRRLLLLSHSTIFYFLHEHKGVYVVVLDGLFRVENRERGAWGWDINVMD